MAVTPSPADVTQNLPQRNQAQTVLASLLSFPSFPCLIVKTHQQVHNLLVNKRM
jgi:hypothetical protein